MQQSINEYQSATEMMTQAAVAHALNSEWSDAIRANRKLIAQDPLDAEAHNRLGKALAASGHLQDAIATYSRVLELDPHNVIARRYLTRLEGAGDAEVLTEISGAAIEMARVSGSATGSAIVTRLVRMAGADVLGGSTIGDQLTLEPSPAGIRVSFMPIPLTIVLFTVGGSSSPSDAGSLSMSATANSGAGVVASVEFCAR